MQVEIETMPGENPGEKKKFLFEKQIKMLDEFLEKGAISQTQYDKSTGDLKQKMGF